MPKPPPGYRQRRTEGFPLPDLEALFGHVFCALGPEIATSKSQPAATGGSRDSGKGSVGVKRARSPTADEGGGKRRSGDANGTVQSNGDRKAPETGRSPMEVDADDRGAEPDRKPGAAVKSDLEGEGEGEGGAEAIDPVQAGLEAAKKAFSRVLDVWEGAATEGKRGLHQRVVARLGRMLIEAEATAVAQEVKASESEVTARVLSVFRLGKACCSDSSTSARIRHGAEWGGGKSRHGLVSMRFSSERDLTLR